MMFDVRPRRVFGVWPSSVDRTRTVVCFSANVGFGLINHRTVATAPARCGSGGATVRSRSTYLVIPAWSTRGGWLHLGAPLPCVMGRGRRKREVQGWWASTPRQTSQVVEGGNLAVMEPPRHHPSSLAQQGSPHRVACVTHGVGGAARPHGCVAASAGPA